MASLHTRLILLPSSPDTSSCMDCHLGQTKLEAYRSRSRHTLDRDCLAWTCACDQSSVTFLAQQSSRYGPHRTIVAKTLGIAGGCQNDTEGRRASVRNMLDKWIIGPLIEFSFNPMIQFSLGFEVGEQELGQPGQSLGTARVGQDIRAIPGELLKFGHGFGIGVGPRLAQRLTDLLYSGLGQQGWRPAESLCGLNIHCREQTCQRQQVVRRACLERDD
jgi:hypothetical protein